MDTQTKSNIFLVFQINKETYATCINNVSGVMKIKKMEKYSSSPYYIRGSVKSENATIPVFDVSEKLNMKKTKKNANTKECIIVYVDGIDEDIKIGIPVDTVLGVHKSDEDKVQLYKFKSEFIKELFDGNILIDNKQINIVDFNNLITINELHVLKNIKHSRVNQN